MFLAGIEFVIRERQKDILQEAEQLRLLHALERQLPVPQKNFWKITHRLGVLLANWGLKLQSSPMEAPSQIRAIGVVDVECPQC